MHLIYTHFIRPDTEYVCITEDQLSEDLAA